MQQLDVEDRAATVEERQVLARWSSWGAIAQVFDNTQPAWSTAYAELKSLLDDDAYRAARRTTINAHCTSPEITTQMWSALEQLGFDGGVVVEPGCGSGTFVGTAPDSARMIGVELDPTTAGIAARLYPEADIRAESFADTRVPRGVDAAVGNVAFGDIRLHDPLHNGGNHSIHNHFIIKSAEPSLRTGKSADVASVVSTLAPEQLVEVVERLGPRRQVDVFRALSPEHASSVFGLLDPSLQRDLLAALGGRRAAVLFAGLDADDRVRILAMRTISAVVATGQHPGMPAGRAGAPLTTEARPAMLSDTPRWAHARGNEAVLPSTCRRCGPERLSVTGGRIVMSDSISTPLNRRTLLRATAVTTVASAVSLAQGRAAFAAPTPPLPEGDTRGGRWPFSGLDRRIRDAMTAYAIPGVAVGMLYRGREYVRGYGVTNVDYPTPVDGDTVFRVASNTKTFTGTAVMRLVEQGRLNLDETVRTYLPDFQTSDASVAATVTLRQLLNHTAGWFGDYIVDTGQGDDALARYVTRFIDIPQLTRPGEVFSYNNAALSLAGRIIEVVTGVPYEQALRDLLIDPLGLGHSRFFSDEIIGFNIAASHDIVDGKAVVNPTAYRLPRAINPAGGLISSARDLLRYARFHLGDGTAPGGGPRLLTERSLRAMRSDPGPGGTLIVELDGMGVTWMLRPTAEGPRVVQHGGDLPGQHSGFLLVPDRRYALVMLTNSDGGPLLLNDLFADDWALRRYAGVSNLHAVPRALSPSDLAAYEGTYVVLLVNPDGSVGEVPLAAVGENGQLTLKVDDVVLARLAFYRRDYVLILGPAGEPTPNRANFVRGDDGNVAWLRVGGRLYRHLEPGARLSAAVTPDAATQARAALLRRL